MGILQNTAEPAETGVKLPAQYKQLETTGSIKQSWPCASNGRTGRRRESDHQKLQHFLDNTCDWRVKATKSDTRTCGSEKKNESLKRDASTRPVTNQPLSLRPASTAVAISFAPIPLLLASSPTLNTCFAPGTKAINVNNNLTEQTRTYGHIHAHGAHTRSRTRLPLRSRLCISYLVCAFSFLHTSNQHHIAIPSIYGHHRGYF